MKEILFKTNDLILANNNLKSNEYKLFNKILYSCQKTKDDKLRVATISHNEIKEIFKMAHSGTIVEIEHLLTKFREVSIKFKWQGRSIGTGLITQWERVELTNVFKCYLSSELYEVLMNYKQLGYSPIDIKMVRQVKGSYAQKLYELLRKWSGIKNEITYSLLELKQHFNIEEGKSYDRYINFKNKTIKPAVKEINEKLNMEVDFKENKIGRSVVSLTFFIVDHEPRHYNFEKIDSDGKEVLEDQIGIDELSKYATTDTAIVDDNKKISSVAIKAMEELEKYKIKISAKTLERNLNTYGEDIFKRSINTLINQKESGKKITAPVGYLNGILEKLKANAEIAATKAKNEGTKTLSFTNYSQREYDYDALEKQLLGWDE